MTETRCARDDLRRLLVLSITRPQDLVTLSVRELDLALRLARRARLLGRLAVRLQAAGQLDRLPAVAADQLAAALAMADARKRIARWELDRIARAVRPAPEIPLVVLKGCAYLLLGLPNAPGRIFADVDLMTGEGRLDRVEALLNARGWQTARLTPYDQNYYRKWTHELPPLRHREREVEVDLHHNILPRTARLKPAGRELLRASRQLPGSRYRVLADEDIVLHAMVHLMFNDDLADKLRDLVDIGDLIAHFSGADEGFWSALLARAQALGLRRPAWYCLRFLELSLEAGIPETVLQQTGHWGPPAPVRRLMDRIVPLALFPRHPDGDSAGVAAARILLYLRSHWIRMPPWLLTYHLAHKAVAGGLRRRPGRDAGQATR